MDLGSLRPAGVCGLRNLTLVGSSELSISTQAWFHIKSNGLIPLLFT